MERTRLGCAFSDLCHNVINGEERPLPEWEDFGQLFTDGVAILLVQLVYTLPFWLLACIAFFSTIGFGGLSDVNEDAVAAGIMATFAASLILGVVLSALNVILCFGQIAGAVIGIAAGPYLLAISGHLYGQIAAKSESKAAKFG